MSTRVVVLVGLAVGVLGCQSSTSHLTPLKSSQAIHDDYAQQIDAVIADASAQIHWPVCEVPPKPGTCGLMASIIDRGHIAKFVTEVCKDDPAAPISDACLRALLDTFDRAMASRYPRSSKADVMAACASTPGKCGTFVDIELLYIASHDDAVFTAAKARVEELKRLEQEEQQRTSVARRTREEQDEQQRLAWQATAAALQGVSDGMAQARARSSEARPPSYGAPMVYAPPPPTVSQSRRCSSDFECGGPGYTCAKPAGALTGECARAVNSFGSQDFTSSPRLDSVGAGQRQCTFTTECPFGFRCDQGRCMK